MHRYRGVHALLKEEHQTLRAGLDQLRSDIAGYRDAVAQVCSSSVCMFTLYSFPYRFSNVYCLAIPVLFVFVALTCHMALTTAWPCPVTPLGGLLYRANVDALLHCHLYLITA